MQRTTHYEVLTGLWNPRESGWSWVSCGSFDTRDEAAKFVDRQIAEHFDLIGERVTPKHREAYKGPPFVVTKVMSSIELKIEGAAPSFSDA